MNDHDVRLTIPWDEVFVVEPNYDGWRLDLYLTQKIQRATRSQIRRIIRNSDVRIAGRPARTASVVRPGDEIRMPRIERIDPMTPLLDDIRVLLERPELIIINKPAGTLVHRNAAEVSRTVDMWATRHENRTGDRLEPIHRTDRDTSGILVIGRGIENIRDLRAAFENNRVQKTYLAIVDDPQKQWTVNLSRSFDQPLGPDIHSSVRLRMGLGTLTCATHASCLVRHHSRALLRVNIEQGRQHQIRAHLSLAGTPIVGDKLYAMGDQFFEAWLQNPGHPDLTAQLAVRWHALHAWRIALPLGARMVNAQCAPPAHFSALLGRTPCELSDCLNDD